MRDVLIGDEPRKSNWLSGYRGKYPQVDFLEKICYNIYAKDREGELDAHSKTFKEMRLINF
jgi:hypothetical protein